MTLENLSKTEWKTDQRIIIFGAGYVGLHLYQFLRGKGVDVTLVRSRVVDYHHGPTLNKYLCNHPTDVVINCSGFTGRPNVDQGELCKELCWNLNVISPLQVNTICNNLGIKYVHISSGCIYDGYEKEFTEEDKPNFGLFDHSSFYSKSKHAFELMSDHLTNKIVRIRMPISPFQHARSYITKIFQYNNLIEYKNSKTYIPDLCHFVENILMIDDVEFWRGQDIYNVVNSDPLFTSEVIKSLTQGRGVFEPNLNWKFVEISDLKISAPRSNCVLNGDKADRIYKMRSERQILLEVLNVNQ